MSGRWVNDGGEGEDITIWWEFGAGEALAPEMALRPRRYGRFSFERG